MPTAPASQPAARPDPDDDPPVIPEPRSLVGMEPEVAVEHLFRMHGDRLRRIARMLATGADAEDLLAETFVRVLNALRNGSGPVDDRASYLTVTMRRLAIEQVRKRRSRGERQLEAELFADPKGGQDADDSQLVDAFRSLPPHHREVLWQTVVLGYSAHEIAARTGASSNAVAALAYRARGALRAAYLDHPD